MPVTKQQSQVAQAENSSWAENYLEETPMLNFRHPDLQELIEKRGWQDQSKAGAIKEIYDFCRNEIKFGYNLSGDTPSASEVLIEGLGQCNTKATLFMALLRAVGVPCRTRGSVINKRMQKEAIGTIPFLLAPRYIIHTWAEVYTGGEWIDAEGLIIDAPMLTAVQTLYKNHSGKFEGYAIATPCLKAPNVEWTGTSGTYIQKESIAKDFGSYKNPDTFYKEYGVNLKGIRAWLYRTFLQPWMNRNVEKIRRKATDVPIRE